MAKAAKDPSCKLQNAGGHSVLQWDELIDLVKLVNVL